MPYQKRSFRCILKNGKLSKISMLNINETIFMKNHVSVIVYFWTGKYSFSLSTFLTYLINTYLCT